MKKHYKTIALVVSVLPVITWAFVHPYNIPGDCMEPAIKEGSHVFVNHISRYLRQYQIGDINEQLDRSENSWRKLLKIKIPLASRHNVFINGNFWL